MILTDDSSLQGTSYTFTVTSTLNDSVATNDNGYSFQIDFDCLITDFAAPTSL